MHPALLLLYMEIPMRQRAHAGSLALVILKENIKGIFQMTMTFA